MIYISFGICKHCKKQKYCVESSRGVQCRDFKNKEDYKIERNKFNPYKGKRA
jgi:hypothetical protein